VPWLYEFLYLKTFGGIRLMIKFCEIFIGDFPTSNGGGA